MSTLAQFLLALVGPLAVRVLLALGISAVTFTGVDAALTGLINTAKANWAGMGGAVLGLAGVAGLPACIGLICGAMSARVAAWATASAARWVKK
jgi:hypothetical protein